MIFHQGDIIMMSLDPTKGHEQAGERPAMVLQRTDASRVLNGCTIIAPISSSPHEFPFDVSLDERTRTTGRVLCRHVRSLDLDVRKARYVESAPREIVEECIQNISALIESESA